MKKEIVLLCFISVQLGFCACVFGQFQNKYLDKRFDCRGENEVALGIVQAGNHYLAASSVQTDSTIGFSTLCLFYVDSSGNRGADTVLSAYGKSLWAMQNPTMILAGVNHFLVCCSATDTANRTSVFLMKIDSSLHVVWQLTDTGKGVAWPTQVHQLPDGSFIYCGGSATQKGAAGDAYLTHVSATGGIIWKRYIGNWQADAFQSMVVNDTDIVLVMASGNLNYIVKTDMAGNEKWRKSVNAPRAHFSIQKLVSGDYLVYGATTDSADISRYQAFAGRLTVNGEFVWKASYYSASSNEIILNATELSSGNILLMGGPIGCFGYKVDSNGNLMHIKFATMMERKDVFNVVSIPGWGFVCIGAAGGTGDSTGMDTWIYKVDSNLCDYPCTPIWGSSHSPDAVSNLSVYPNPFSSEVNITYHLHAIDDSYIRLYSVQGVLVKEIPLTSTEEKLQLDMSQAAPGFYILQLVNNNMVIKTQKLLRY